ncbi:MAG: lamin tail domain-containing protein [Pseudomonadota bacterium]
MVAGTTSSVFINEIHYDNEDSRFDFNQYVEIANPGGIDLTGWTVVLYRANGGGPYDTFTLSGSDTVQGITYGRQVDADGTLSTDDPDSTLDLVIDTAGIALVDATGNVVQFLSYEGTFTATSGPASGLTSTDIGVSEGAGGLDGGVPGEVTKFNQSLQLQGTGSTAGDFTWGGNITQTQDAVNTGQTLTTPPPPPSPVAGDVVINEIHADPASDISGDANGDGARDFSDDEFVELVNTSSSAVDLSGFTLSDSVSVRHTFAAGTTLEAGQAIVVFGGGTPTGTFGGATVVTASSGAVGLNNGGDTVTLVDTNGATVDEVVYGSEGGSNQSLTRDPDGTGDFVQHTSATDANGALFSPGTQVDGSAFAAPVTIVLDETFETDGSVDTGDGVRYTFSSGEGSDGSFDFFTRTDGSDISTAYDVTGQGGDFFFAAQDTDSVPGLTTDDEQSIFFTGLDISGLDSLFFSVDLAEDDSSDGNQDWDPDDFFQVYATIDGGTPFLIFAVENDGSQFNGIPLIDTDLDGVGDGTEITANFATFTAAIAGTGSTLDLELRYHLDSGDEDLSIDNVRVADAPPAPPTGPGTFAFAGDVEVLEGDTGTTELTFTINRTGGAVGAVTVNLAIDEGSTANSADFASMIPTSVEFADGETSKTVTLEVSGDTDIEENETLTLLIDSVSAGAIDTEDASATGTILNDDFPPQGPAEVFINEIHYDNSGGDVGEAVEVAGPAGTDLSGWQILLYNGNGGGVYDTINLTGTIPDQDDGFGTLGFARSGIQNGSPDGLALVRPDGSVVQFLSYEGSFTATDGAAAGLTSEDIGVSEGSVPEGTSLQLGGTGFVYDDFTWQTSSTETFDAINNGQDFVAGPAAGTFFIDDAQVVEGDSGNSALVFNIFRVGGTDGQVVIGDIGIALDGTQSPTFDFDDLGVPNFEPGGTIFEDGQSFGQFIVNINGDTLGEPNETFELRISDVSGGAAIGDGVAIGTIINDDPVNLQIGEIQGATHTSIWVGSEVTTTGVVTAVAANGFYMQDPDGDGDSETSDAIFVFTGDAPVVLLGDGLTVTGTVGEFRGGNDPANLTITQISDASIMVDSVGNPLPTAVLIGPDGLTPPTEVVEDDGFTDFDPANDGIDFWESLEGMLVEVQNPVSVDSTNGFGELWTAASDGAGNLLATNVSAEGLLVIDGGAGGLGEFDAGAGSDFNPERIQIDSAGPLNGVDIEIPDVGPGTLLNNVTGIVDYAFENFQIRPTEAVTVAEASTNISEMTSLVGGLQNQLSVATYNVLNLDINDADGDDDVANGRFDSVAFDIGVNLAAPDIVVLQEVQDDSGSANDGTVSAQLTLEALAQSIFDQTGVQYSVFDNPFISDGESGGQPGGNIRVAFLYRDDRVDLDEATAFTITDETGAIDAAFANSRAPLGAEFTFNGEKVTVIGNHFTSKIGSDSTFSATQPPTNAGALARAAQAAAVNAVVDDLLTADPEARIVVAGDFNEFQFEEPLEVLSGELDFDGGSVTPGGEPVLTNLTYELEEEDRFSVLFQGNAQQLDHIFASESLAAGAQIDAVHTNTPVAAPDSDHDPILALFNVGTRTTLGTDGVDLLEGNDADDIIFGGTDDDTVIGNGGDDQLNGGQGDDFLDGGDGDDTLNGGNQKDVLIGGDGEDILNGGNGGDRLEGGADNDTLNGGSGRDTLLGGSGDDTLDGGRSDDRLNGGEGADILTGGVGSDLFIFGTDGTEDDADIVTDFELGDALLLLNTGGKMVSVTQDGDDALITVDGVLIATIQNSPASFVSQALRFDGDPAMFNGPSPTALEEMFEAIASEDLMWRPGVEDIAKGSAPVGAAINNGEPEPAIANPFLAGHMIGDDLLM